MRTYLSLLIILLFQNLNSQALLSDSLIGTYSSSYFASQGIPGTQYVVDVYRIVYTTLDANDEVTIASGLLSVPQVSCDLPVIVYCHGTVFNKEDVPSRFNSEGNLGAAMASSGYLSILPDYLGLGDSPGMHPYVHAETQGETSFNMIRAAEQFCNENDIVLNGQLFLTGYSQGGHASMALLKHIQEYLPDDFVLNTVATVCGSGPFDISGVQYDMVMEDMPYPTGAYLPYVLFSYQHVYGDLYVDLSDIFVSPYDETLLPLFDGNHSGSQIQSAMPSIPNNIFHPSLILELNTDPLHPINVALKANDLFDWSPQTPLRMIYCTGDEQVAFENSLVAETTMQANGSPDVTALLGGTGDHGDCFEPYLLSTLLWFDQLKQDCVTSIHEVRSEFDWAIHPNPVENLFYLSVESSQQLELDLSITDLTGKMIYSQKFDTNDKLIEIDFSTMTRGLYMVHIKKGDIIETKKVVLN